ncbi:Uu.00g085580.m01.CDS01 [Anthostomella pinea]|uniref:Uu.00g085580.m01.CDS01 n=1 Tax=Anthostomella pinea TaxID=933095 RepID=A0AAI8VML4_9PEZI|nr:Uu.00g085580.m01.CDS01 [Anthostomella pinea]
MSSTLNAYSVPASTQSLLTHVFSQPAFMPSMQPFEKRPRLSELRTRVELVTMKLDFTMEPPAIREAIGRSINRSWEAYTEGSVGPSDFIRTPLGAPFEIASINGKGRGLIASRIINAGEVILEDSPVLLLPFKAASDLIFLLLPRKALEALLLLHNAHPNEGKYTVMMDIPVHHLLDQLSGVLSTNAFEGD